MKKNKKKSFWGETIDDQSQINGMEYLLKLTELVESGSPLPDNVDFSPENVDDAGFDAEVAMGLDDAVSRLMTKKNSAETAEFNPLTRVTVELDVPVVEAIHTEEPVIREMEEVKHYPKMAPPSSIQTVTAEDVIPDDDAEEDDDFVYDDKPLEYSDFSIVTAEDDWVYVTNSYNPDLRHAFSIFNLRGYSVEKTDMYNLMLTYVPLLFAFLAGPALIVKQDDAIFRKFMRSSIDRGINVDKKKFMVFTVQNKKFKMFLVYMIDEFSRQLVMDTLLPSLVEDCEETDFFTQLAGLVLNPMINPYGMVETMWPGDRASEELDTPAKVEEFCNLMMKELGIEPVESSKTSYSSAEAGFKKRSVIGDIQNFLKTVKIAKEDLEKQMNPDNYEEKFLEEKEEPAEDNTAEETRDIKEEAEAPSQEPVVKEESSENVSEDVLFDDIGEDVPETKVETVPEVKKEAPAPNVAENKPAKPIKAGADGKKRTNTNRSFEIPVQR